MAAALILAIAAPWANAIRLDMSARAMEREAQQIAAQALPPPARSARAQLGTALLAHTNGRQRIETAATLLGELTALPDIAIARLDASADAPLVTANLTAPNADSTTPLRERLAARSYTAEHTASDAPGRRAAIDLTVVNPRRRIKPDRTTLARLTPRERCAHRRHARHRRPARHPSISASAGLAAMDSAQSRNQRRNRFSQTSRRMAADLASQNARIDATPLDAAARAAEASAIESGLRVVAINEEAAGIRMVVSAPNAAAALAWAAEASDAIAMGARTLSIQPVPGAIEADITFTREAL